MLDPIPPPIISRQLTNMHVLRKIAFRFQQENQVLSENRPKTIDRGPETEHQFYFRALSKSLATNHPDPIFDAAAQDAAMVSSSNFWDRGPDRSSNIPYHL
jgi:hypothetical protein